MFFCGETRRFSKLNRFGGLNIHYEGQNTDYDLETSPGASMALIIYDALGEALKSSIDNIPSSSAGPPPTGPPTVLRILPFHPNSKGLFLPLNAPDGSMTLENISKFHVIRYFMVLLTFRCHSSRGTPNLPDQQFTLD